MRNAFLDTLFELACQDERIVFITGDLGYRVVEKLMEQRPRQFLNAGVAEQNMTGIAAGLALSGRIAVTYSIANFPTLRCLEQIRNDICYHEANVKIVSVGGGVSYGAMSFTHHALEDLGIMRCLPNLVVMAPGDPVEARAATRAMLETPQPCYLRLGKAGEPTVHAGPIDFQIGRAIRLRDGHAATLLTTGAMLQTGVRVGEALAKCGISLRVASMHTLKPIDEVEIQEAVEQTGALVTLEEHSLTGGLGTAVAEVLAERNWRRVPFRRLAFPAAFLAHIGSQEYLRAKVGLGEEDIAHTIRLLLDSAAIA